MGAQSGDGGTFQSAGQHLLFGMIALQNDFITREQLVVAFDTWVHDKSLDLGQILIKTGALNSDDHDMLSRLVAKFLQKHQGDTDRSLAALSSGPQVRHDLGLLKDADLDASLGQIGQEMSDSVDEKTVTFHSHDPTEHFRILRPHAKGGLGQVSVALDMELNREVAVKEILAQLSGDAVARERFQREAEITGGLEHPGIVPVYALGQSADGRPYYAMRFVKGDSLKQALEQFHRGDHPNRNDLGARQLAMRQLLGRFIDVCYAVEYAHSRGVLHRDLKPGNIMVGKYGETLVVDWGLAKTLGRREIGSDDATLHTSPAPRSSAHTQAGSVLGTPAYMSPEQAAGKLEELGAATDIYSLGATLYHLLTGQPPFEKENFGELLHKVQTGRFPRPRSISADVPRRLEAICLKAMALKPTDRYSTARKLADDVEHWLADEPITATPDTLGEWMSRWRRKHKAWAQAGSLSLMMIALVATIAFFWINGANDANIRLAKTNGELAEKNQKLASAEAEQAILAKTARDDAIAKAKLARRHLYIAHMNLAQVAWELANLSQVNRLLDFHRPPAGRAEGTDDPRGFEWYFWDGQCHRDLLTLNGHTGGVSSVAFSPDGQQLATGSWDMSIKVWDTISGRELNTLKGHSGGVLCLAYSPDGSRLASGGIDQTVKLWNVATGQELLTLKGHTYMVQGVAFSPDGSRLASASFNPGIKLWDTTTGRELLSLNNRQGAPVANVAFSPDGQRLASANQDQTIELWDLTTAQVLMAWKGHSIRASSVAFSPDGRHLASAGADHEIKIWNATSGTQVLALKGHTESVESIAFSPDGKKLVSGSIDSTVKLWDAASGNNLLTFKGHAGAIRSVAFSPDGQHLASGGYDSAAKFWDANTEQDLATLTIHTTSVDCIAFSPSGQTMASGGWDNNVTMWDVATGVEVGVFKGHTKVVSCVAYSPDGSRVASGSHDRTLNLWDLASGANVLTIKGHELQVNGLAFSPDGRQLASASDDRTVRIWDATTGKETLQLKGNIYSVTGLAFSPNGRRLASVGQDGTIRLWDAMTGMEIQTIKGQMSSLTSVAFSPDGNWLASAGHDNSVRLWDATTGQAGLTLNGHSQFVTSVAFSPDSSRLVSASFDKTAKLWDVTTGQELLTLGGFQQQVSGISFSPNGRQLATASREGTVKVWDARDFDIQHLTRAARGVVARHSADSATRQELIVAIKSDPMLDERTRQQAIDFTEYFRENPNVYEARGRQLAARGELAKAAVNFGRAFDLRPDNVNLAQNWSYLLFSSGNVDEYRKACAKALLGFEHSDDARTLLVTVRILILSPGATDDSASPIRLAVRAVKLDPKLWWCHHALAGAYLRNKQYEEALKTLNEIEERKLVPDPPAPDSWLAEILNGSLRTVALLKLKRVTEARVAMEKVQTTSEQHLKPTPEMSFGEITPFWWNWYPIQAFRNEAADLLHEIDGSK